MTTYFVLILWCVTCQPQQLFSLHGIPSYQGGSTKWADLICKTYGDILSGDWDRRNLNRVSADGQDRAKKDFIVYSCTKESGEL